MVNGKSHTVGGYRWAALSASGKPLPSLPPLPPRAGVAVAQYTKEGELLHVWPSQLEAAASCGCSSGFINNAVAGLKPTAGGYRWAKLVNNKPLPSLPPLRNRPSNVVPVRNVSTNQIFTTRQQLQQAGFDPDSVGRVLSGRLLSHKNCQWQHVGGGT